MDIGGFFTGRGGMVRTALVIWLFACAILLIQSPVWSAVYSADTDDVMRLVQVRDLLAGQSWFNPDQSRAGPPAGFSMHWSRLPDALPALIIAMLTPLTGGWVAEQVAIGVAPLVPLAGALLACGLIARRLGGPSATAGAMILFTMLGPAVWQFAPGRIDHHNWQLCGILGMLAGIMHLDRGARAGIAAAVAGAVSLSVGLEGLPFWGALSGCAGLAFAFLRGDARRGLLGFGAATAIATPLLALAFNPARYVLSGACDQAAGPVLAAAMAGGAALALVALINPASIGLRVGGVAAAGVAAAGAFLSVSPACAAGPMALTNPAIGPIWMNLVVENYPLLRSLVSLGSFALSGIAALVLGFGSLVVLWRTRPQDRAAVLIAGAAFLIAVGLVFYQVRVMTYAVSLAAPLMGAGLAALVARLGVAPKDQGAALIAGLLVLMALPNAAGAAAGILAPPAPVQRAGGAALKPADDACWRPSAYRGLAHLPPGLAVAPIDVGPFILESSGLSVLSAPYHRNAEGILAAYDILAAPPARALALARARGVTYVVMCRTGQVARLDLTRPEGLAARLEAGQQVPGLLPLTGGAPVRVWRVAPHS